MGQAEWAKRQEAKRRAAKDWGSVASSETESTAVPPVVVVDHEEARRMAGQDKEVRKLEKLLREIEKLENLAELDKLQKVKLARKPEVVIQLDTARGLFVI